MGNEKKKKYYHGQNKIAVKGKHSFKTIAFGSHGILCTSDKIHQKFCGMESRSLLEESFQKQYGPFNLDSSSAKDVDTQSSDSVSLEDILSQEIAEAKSDNSSKERLWEFTDTKCTGVEFLELHPRAYKMLNGRTLSDFLTSIFLSKPPPQSRHIRRMVPLESIFQATPSNLSVEVKRLATNTVIDVVRTKRQTFTFKLEVCLFRHSTFPLYMRSLRVEIMHLSISTRPCAQFVNPSPLLLFPPHLQPFLI